MATRLEHANLAVRDVDEMIRFLRTAFPEFGVRGEGKTGQGNRWVHLGTENTYLALNEATKEPAERWVPYGGRPGTNHLGYEVDDAEAVRTRLVSAGYTQSTVPNKHPHRTRVYFYDPGHHGQDIHQLEGHYGTYLPSVTRREDLNNLLRLALGHVSVSNLVVSGGDTPAAGSPQRVGLLGADYEISEGRYRITRIYRSGHYNSPNRLLRAPLDQPGVDVQEGDYLLAVDGVDVVATRNIYSYFEGKAFKPVEITVGLEPARRGTRTYTIIPISSENALRRANWALANQRLVDEMTQGQIRYMYVPNYTDGLEPFFREVLSNPGSKGFVIDERFAGGGITADYLIELLSRVPLYYYVFRHGDDLAIPTNPTPAARVLLINNVTASDAETFALMFKLGRLGRTVGTRTFGAGVGSNGWIPRLIDGGRVSIPSRAAFNPDNGTWTIENQGVSANIEVEWLPEDWRAGVDPQLDAAVKAVLQFIVDNVDNVKQKKKPDYPKLPTGSRTGTR